MSWGKLLAKSASSGNFPEFFPQRSSCYCPNRNAKWRATLPPFPALTNLSSLCGASAGRNHICLSHHRHLQMWLDRKSTRLNSSHTVISYAVFCLKKRKKNQIEIIYITINTE